MPKTVKIIQKKFDDVVRILFKEFPDFIEPKESKGYKTTIDADLARLRFIDSKDRKFKDIEERWHDPKIPTTYTQGDMDASFFSLIMQLPSIRAMKNNNTDDTTIPYQDYPHVTMDSLRSNRDTFSFTYFDRDNIRCAVSLTYLKTEPELWTLSFIRNTTGAYDGRYVLFISPSALMPENDDSKKLPHTPTTTALQTFLDTLHSEKIINLMRNIISSEGRLDIQRVTDLDSKIYQAMSEHEQEAITQIIETHASAESLKEIQSILDEDKAQKTKKRLPTYALITLASIIVALVLFFTGGLAAIVPGLITLAGVGAGAAALAIFLTSCVIAVVLTSLFAIGNAAYQRFKPKGETNESKEPHAPFHDEPTEIPRRTDSWDFTAHLPASVPTHPIFRQPMEFSPENSAFRKKLIENYTRLLKRCLAETPREPDDSLYPEVLKSLGYKENEITASATKEQLCEAVIKAMDQTRRHYMPHDTGEGSFELRFMHFQQQWKAVEKNLYRASKLICDKVLSQKAQEAPQQRINPAP